MQLVLLGAAAITLAVGGFGFGVRYQKGETAKDIVAAQQVAAYDRFRREERMDLSSAAHEKRKVEVETIFQTIIKEVDRVVEKPVYRNQCFDDDGLRELNAAIAAANRSAASKPAPAVPARAQP